jgi:hypothetical protein
MNMRTMGIGVFVSGIATVIVFAVWNVAFSETLRVAEYNIDCSDQGNNSNITGPSAGIPAIIQAI